MSPRTLTKTSVSVLIGLATAASVRANESVELDALTVYSDTVALQQPSTTFAMPVTLLRFEPGVDVQGRNGAETQADISIRGGTFENTGFSLGALPIYDPQTGHYFAEIPVAPAMLGAPEVRTGAANAVGGWNATAGGLGYGWRRIREGAHGFATATAGDNSLNAGEVYASFAAPAEAAGGRVVGADFSVAASQGEGSRSFGDHDYARYAGRVQLADERSQTDVFAGYQSKFFGWRNLYAGPFNSNESENIKTTLYAVNHEVKLDAEGDYVSFGAYHRRNVDDYEFNRLPPADTFLHETRVNGAALEGRGSFTDATALRYRAGVVADEIDSTALTFGPFESRSQYYAGLFAEHRIDLSAERELTLLGGANYDGSNRDPSAVSPVAEVALKRENAPLRRVYVSYAGGTQLPTYTALSSNPAGGLFGGNPNLGRAKSRNVEAGADVAAGGWALRGAVFYRQDRDLLDWVFGGAIPPPPVRRAVEGDIDTYGFEASARRDWERLSVIFGYTLLDKNEDYLAPGESSFYAYNYAEHRLTAAFVADLGAGFGLRMDNELRHQADNALRRRGEDKIISSLGLDYEVPGVRGLTLSAQVDNLWNTYFEEVPLVPGVRREWSVSATYAW